MPRIDDASVIRIAERLRPELAVNLPLQQVDQRLTNRLMHKQIIRCNTGLSAVEIFSKYNAARGRRQIRICIHNTRTFTAQLQHGRGQMLRRSACHGTSAARASGIKDQVKPLFEQPLCAVDAAGHDNRLLRLKYRRKQTLQHLCRMQRIRTGLDDHRIARRNCRRCRLDREQKRIIPRAHHQYRSERRGLGIAVRAKL